MGTNLNGNKFTRTAFGLQIQPCWRSQPHHKCTATLATQRTSGQPRNQYNVMTTRRDVDGNAHGSPSARLQLLATKQPQIITTQLHEAAAILFTRNHLLTTFCH